MKTYNSRWLSILLGTASLLTATAAFLFFCAGDAAPVLLHEPKDPAATVELFFNSVCRGDYATAARCCEGGLPEEAVPAESDAAALYEALVSHRSWEWAGEPFVSGRRAYFEVAFTCPDAVSLTEGLAAAVQSTLEQRVEAAANNSDIYNEDGSYREELVMEIWHEVLAAQLETAADHSVTAVLPISLRLEGHEWLIECSDELLTALRSGL